MASLIPRVPCAILCGMCWQRLTRQHPIAAEPSHLRSNACRHHPSHKRHRARPGYPCMPYRVPGVSKRCRCSPRLVAAGFRSGYRHEASGHGTASAVQFPRGVLPVHICLDCVISAHCHCAPSCRPWNNRKKQCNRHKRAADRVSACLYVCLAGHENRGEE